MRTLSGLASKDFTTASVMAATNFLFLFHGSSFKHVHMNNGHGLLLCFPHPEAGVEEFLLDNGAYYKRISMIVKGEKLSDEHKLTDNPLTIL